MNMPGTHIHTHTHTSWGCPLSSAQCSRCCCWGKEGGNGGVDGSGFLCRRAELLQDCCTTAAERLAAVLACSEPGGGLLRLFGLWIEESAAKGEMEKQVGRPPVLRREG